MQKSNRLPFLLVLLCHGQRCIQHMPTQRDVIGYNNFASFADVEHYANEAARVVQVCRVSCYYILFWCKVAKFLHSSCARFYCILYYCKWANGFSNCRTQCRQLYRLQLKHRVTTRFNASNSLMRCAIKLQTLTTCRHLALDNIVWRSLLLAAINKHSNKRQSCLSKCHWYRIMQISWKHSRIDSYISYLPKFGTLCETSSSALLHLCRHYLRAPPASPFIP